MRVLYHLVQTAPQQGIPHLPRVDSLPVPSLLELTHQLATRPLVRYELVDRRRQRRVRRRPRRAVRAVKVLGHCRVDHRGLLLTHVLRHRLLQRNRRSALQSRRVLRVRDERHRVRRERGRLILRHPLLHQHLLQSLRARPLKVVRAASKRVHRLPRHLLLRRGKVRVLYHLVQTAPQQGITDSRRINGLVIHGIVQLAVQHCPSIFIMNTLVHSRLQRGIGGISHGCVFCAKILRNGAIEHSRLFFPNIFKNCNLQSFRRSIHEFLPPFLHVIGNQHR